MCLLSGRVEAMRCLRKAGGAVSGGRGGRRAALALRASTAWSGPGDSTRSPEADAIMWEQQRAVLQAVSGLRDDDRLVVAYRYFFDLSEAEMAEALGWARGTVKSRLSRALERLRNSLTEFAHA